VWSHPHLGFVIKKTKVWSGSQYQDEATDAPLMHFLHWLQGEATALLSAVDVLTTCLAAPEGCAVVPGLPEDQYYFTLGCAIAGGLVAGFVSKIEPQGEEGRSVRETLNLFEP
jgi:hypothetical protein